MLGSGANGAGYNVTLKNSQALGTGPLTVNGASASPYGLVLDTSSGSLDVANQIIVNTGKTLEISKTGEEEAALSGNVSGEGSLDVYSVRFDLDLDKLLSEGSSTLWDFTGSGKFDGATFNVITEDPELYDGQTIKLAEEAAILEGIELAGVYFEEAGGADIWNFGLDAAGNLWMSLKGESGGGVPEPATWALLTLGMLGLGFRRLKFN
ncbi:MAG: PEP-CTERM sorting domain-containing protein [Thermoguttaceae bacterium]|nr:PEP-CTERM sorting domain-containing protein [Thermoguttaceae bacterium]